MGEVTTRRPVLRLRDGHISERPDTVVVEEPLQIRVGSSVLTTTMRTPGHDLDLVAGWLVAEGAVASADDIVSIRMCTDELNTVVATLAAHAATPRPRAFATTSACGVCGSDAVIEVRSALRWPPHDDRVALARGVISSLPTQLRTAQRTFDRTGGLHAAGVFSAAGEQILVREDVGRHNAVDKVIGAALRNNLLPLTGHVLQVSGRASFELVQKSAMAGIPMLSAISAPSSLAVDLATECGITLVGFVRGDAMNVYSRPDRVGASTDR
ncbi:MAG TPA: formate dehydrogenase accessory sulfurtransferase FdhD [Jiangellaceae bacterium]|nr:formate dehydrogenase accessory sulfurtransferase FdhD [Jiangellaceae bacterium]